MACASAHAFKAPSLIHIAAARARLEEKSVRHSCRKRGLAYPRCRPQHGVCVLVLAGLRFVLADFKAGGTLRIWAGVSGGSLTVNASVGGKQFYTEELVATPSDYFGKVLRSNVFTLRNVPAVSATGRLIVDFTVQKPRMPPPPPPPPAPPPPPPCKQAMCVSMSSCSSKGQGGRFPCGKVGLDWPWIGKLDWIHWTGKSPLQKYGGSLIKCACDGKECPCGTASGTGLSDGGVSRISANRLLEETLAASF